MGRGVSTSWHEFESPFRPKVPKLLNFANQHCSRPKVWVKRAEDGCYGIKRVRFKDCFFDAEFADQFTSFQQCKKFSSKSISPEMLHCRCHYNRAFVVPDNVAGLSFTIYKCWVSVYLVPTKRRGAPWKVGIRSSTNRWGKYAVPVVIGNLWDFDQQFLHIQRKISKSDLVSIKPDRVK